VKLLLDMDTGVDDAVALALAMHSPEAELLAVTTVAGNARVEDCARNTLLLAELLHPGAAPPVARGAAAPLGRPLVTAPEVHGDDGLGGPTGSLPPPGGTLDSRPAHEMIASLARAHPGEVTLVATGPLTNVARALALAPELPSLLERTVIMGGAFEVPGNTGPVAEFNIYVDPEAAATVFSSGLEPTLVPLDATIACALTREQAERYAGGALPRALPATPDAAAILGRALDYYMRFQEVESGLAGGYMHDPLTVVVALSPEIVVRSKRFELEVVPDGPERGRTVASDGGAIEVAEEVDAELFSRILEERVLGPVFGRPGA
jgi:purine nucleosidase